MHTSTVEPCLESFWCISLAAISPLGRETWAQITYSSFIKISLRPSPALPGLQAAVAAWPVPAASAGSRKQSLDEYGAHVDQDEEDEQDGKEDEAVDVELRHHPVLAHHLGDHRRRRDVVRLRARRRRCRRRSQPRLPHAALLVLLVAEDLEVEQNERVFQQGSEDEEYAG